MTELDIDIEDIAEAGADIQDKKVEYQLIKQVREKSALFMIENEGFWIPRSVISEVDQNHVWVRNWFYEKTFYWLE